MRKSYATVIILSFCGMSVEMVASRIMAPFFGTSLFVWACIIGVVLAFGSLGSYLGGVFADKYSDENKVIGNIITVASFCVIGIGVLKNLLLIIFSLPGIVLALLASIMLFAPISCVLCMATPVIIKKAVNRESGKIGGQSGKIYAVSTLGSIAGVFVTSFVLIPLLSINWILFILACGLSAFALFYQIKFPQIFAVVFSVLLIFYPISVSVLYSNSIEINTLYGNYIIVDDGEKVQILSYRGIQSQKLKNSNKLLSRYSWYYDLAHYFNPAVVNALCFGGAGYVYPQYFAEKYPQANIDVVEIDPQMEKIAQKYFDLQLPNEKINSIIMDGRGFLNQNKKKYDVIFGDAYKSHEPPYEMMTKEASDKIYNSLTDDGVYIANIISEESGIASGILKSYYKTLQSVFPAVYTFRVDGVKNKILVAVKHPITDLHSSNEYYQEMLSTKFTVAENNYRILTDDYAPIDFFGMLLVF